MSKILIIGLDGATFDLMLPWAQRGDLPHLAAMMAGGCYGPLASTIHPVTSAAWPSFMTGMQQGKHGLYDFVQRLPGSYNFELTDGADMAAPSLFELAGRAGQRVIVLNVPLTFPPRAVNGVWVSGMFAQPAPNIALPRQVYAEIVQQVGEYIIVPRYNAWAANPLQDYADQLFAATDKHKRVMEYLMERNEWDLACVVFTSTDLAQHAFWKYMEAGDARWGDVIRKVYQQADDFIGQLRAQAGADTATFIMSDHGAGRLESFVQLNRWLANEGFLHFLPPRTSWRARLVRAAWRAWRRVVPPAWSGKIRAWAGARYDAMRDQMESALFATRVDWPRTRAFSLGACGNIFINQAGREPQGCVAAGAEYEALCAEIIRRLFTLKEPGTGEPLVAQVYRRAEIYRGPYVERAADLVITWRNYGYWGRGRYDFDAPEVFQRQQEADFSHLPLSGTHRPQGVFVAAGANVKAGGRMENLRIIDVAPTVLAMLGAPVPVDMDGRVLGEILAQAPVWQQAAGKAYHAGEGADYSLDEAADIEDRLKALGYL